MVSTVSRQAVLAFWAQVPLLAAVHAVRQGAAADVKSATSSEGTPKAVTGERGTVMDVVA